MTSQATLSHADAASSLLSLSIAAAGSVPISTTTTTTDRPLSAGAITANYGLGLLSTSLTSGTGVQPSPAVSSSLGSTTRHRRLASTGKTRRRLSDARDAASRPSPALLQSSTAALSLASLTLSSSPPASGLNGGSLPLPNSSAAATASFAGASNSLNGVGGLTVLPGSPCQHASSPSGDGNNSIPSAALSSDSNISEDQNKGQAAATPIAIGQGRSGGRKRGVDHKCESCSKIYRHPSCLIKHRWEHTPHWREASKFVLSKHQQVQLLEAAAILSHLSPTATSLPEDRSLWPSFLSGGSLPKVEPPLTSSAAQAHYQHVSSSVPGGGFSRAASNGPRLHDYSIPPSSTGSGGITQLRPGLVGIPTSATPTDITAGGGDTSTGSKPVPINTNLSNATATIAYGVSDSFTGYRQQTNSWNSSSPFDSAHTPSSFVSTTTGGLGLSAGSLPFARTATHSDERSTSFASSSRSRSGSSSRSRSDDDDEIDIEVDGGSTGAAGAGRGGIDDGLPTTRYAGRYGYKGRKTTTWRGSEDEVAGGGVGFSVREEDEIDDDDDDIGDEHGIVNEKNASDRKHQETEWDGLEMDMDMD